MYCTVHCYIYRTLFNVLYCTLLYIPYIVSFDSFDRLYCNKLVDNVLLLLQSWYALGEKAGLDVVDDEAVELDDEIDKEVTAITKEDVDMLTMFEGEAEEVEDEERRKGLSDSKDKILRGTVHLI